MIDNSNKMGLDESNKELDCPKFPRCQFHRDANLSITFDAIVLDEVDCGDTMINRDQCLQRVQSVQKRLNSFPYKLLRPPIWGSLLSRPPDRIMFSEEVNMENIFNFSISFLPSSDLPLSQPKFVPKSHLFFDSNYR